MLFFPLFHFSDNFLQCTKPTQFQSTGLSVLSWSTTGLIWKNFANSNEVSDQCPESALVWFLQRLGIRCENYMHNKQNQKNNVHHNQRIKSLFEHCISSKAVFRGQQHRGAKDAREKKKVRWLWRGYFSFFISVCNHCHLCFLCFG